MATCTPTMLSFFYLTFSVIAARSYGLKIGLIHPESLESPSLQTNLPSEEALERLVTQSKVRADHLSKTLSSSFIETRIGMQVFTYLVKIGIGTFNSQPPYKEYFLEMDTGSGLVWLQCGGCSRCFDQMPKPFPTKTSSSFHPLLNRTTPEPYEYRYADGSSTNGVLAQETFHLSSKYGTKAKIPKVKFGCGLNNNVRFQSSNGNINQIAWIMGLGWDDSSFVKQLGSKANGKFSYCLPLLSGNTSNSYLRFGDDRKCLLKSTKKTQLYRMNWTSPYFVDLQGTSIDKTRLNINPNVFAFNSCAIDTGTPISRIKTPVFEILKQGLEKYISGLKGLKRLSGKFWGLELCYERIKPEKGLGNLPELTFHLRGSRADFVMKADAVFKFLDRDQAVGSSERLCLAMARDDRMSIIGARQQVNHRITYDIKRKQLLFYQQDCARNP